MSDEYAAVKRGKLVLKGDKPKATKRKHKKTNKSEESKVDIDEVKHGGWWKAEHIEDVTGSISIEFGNNSYISALDNGLFTLGAPHGDGEGPSPEEIFTAFPAGETKFALKSGYGKYVGVSKDGTVMGRSDAVGAMEQWEPVWQDGKTAILSSLNKFMCVDPDDDSVIVQNVTAGEHEFCYIRTNRSREVKKSTVPEEEQGNLAEVEVNYVMPTSAVPSQAQQDMLLEFLEEKRFLATGFARTTNARDRTRAAWKEISLRLNSDGRGCIKTWQQWAKQSYNETGPLPQEVLETVQLNIGPESDATASEAYVHSIPVEPSRSTFDDHRAAGHSEEGMRSIAMDVNHPGHSQHTDRPASETVHVRETSAAAGATSDPRRRRLVRRVVRRLPSHRQSYLASLTERLIAIEEQRVGTERMMAQTHKDFLTVCQRISEDFHQLVNHIKNS